jgi:hypothetical protein
MWCVSPHTWNLFLSSRYKDLVQLQVKSYISNRLISKLQHLASYVSRHNFMAYDMIAFLDRSCWAEKHCHLSVCDPTNIDQAKNQQCFTSVVYKNTNKILPSRMSNQSGWQVSQIASTRLTETQMSFLFSLQSYINLCTTFVQQNNQLYN